MGITLLEISLDDADITANAPFSGTGSSSDDSPEEDAAAEDATDEFTASTDEESGRGVPVGPILAIAVLFVLAVLARRALSSDDVVDEG